MRLGIRGTAGSGKTVSANYLRREFGFSHYSFATPIKEIEKLLSQDESIGQWANALFLKRYEANAFKEKVLSIPDLPRREKWQRIGDAGREIRESVFVDYLLDNLPSEGNLEEDIVIDDARRDNEVRALFLKGFTILRLNIDPKVRNQRLLERDKVRMSRKALSHPSEDMGLVPGIGMMSFDNSGDFEDLYLFLENLVATDRREARSG